MDKVYMDWKRCLCYIIICWWAPKIAWRRAAFVGGSSSEWACFFLNIVHRRCSTDSRLVLLSYMIHANLSIPDVTSSPSSVFTPSCLNESITDLGHWMNADQRRNFTFSRERAGYVSSRNCMKAGSAADKSGPKQLCSKSTSIIRCLPSNRVLDVIHLARRTAKTRTSVSST